jgi:hypothetical protein
MKKLRLVALAALLAAWPGVARADSPLMEYIEGWSGPGPFKVLWFAGLDLRLWCQPSAEAKEDSRGRQQLNCLSDDGRRVKSLVLFNFNIGHNDGGQLFSDDPNDKRDVKQTTLEVAYMYRVNPIVDVGSGIQWVHLTGDGGTGTNSFDVWKTGVPIRLTITPLGLKRFSPKNEAWSRFIHLKYESTFFGGTTQASDFGNTTSHYKSGKEFQSRVSLNLDFAPIVSWLKPHS